MYSNYNTSDRRLVQYEQLSITYQIWYGKNFAIIDILRFLDLLHVVVLKSALTLRGHAFLMMKTIGFTYIATLVQQGSIFVVHAYELFQFKYWSKKW